MKRDGVLRSSTGKPMLEDRPLRCKNGIELCKIWSVMEKDWTPIMFNSSRYTVYHTQCIVKLQCLPARQSQECTQEICYSNRTYWSKMPPFSSLVQCICLFVYVGDRGTLSVGQRYVEWKEKRWWRVKIFFFHPFSQRIIESCTRQEICTIKASLGFQPRDNAGIPCCKFMVTSKTEI